MNRRGFCTKLFGTTAAGVGAVLWEPKPSFVKAMKFAENTFVATPPELQQMLIRRYCELTTRKPNA